MEMNLRFTKGPQRRSFGLRHLIPLLSEKRKKRGFGAKNRGFNPLFWRV
jgi:hypothetical protein